MAPLFRLAFPLLLAASLARADWESIRQLTSSPGNSNLPQTGAGLAVSDSFVHIVFADRNNAGEPKVFYLRSPDSGVSWDETYEIGHHSLVNRFSIAADNSGNVHFINSRHPDGELWHRRSTDNGLSWQDATELLPYVEAPSLLCAGEQEAYLFHIPRGFTPELHLLRSTDGGETWESPRRLVGANGFVGLSTGASDNGRLDAAYAYGPQGRLDAYYVHSTDHGVTWTSQAGMGIGSSPTGIWRDLEGNGYAAFSSCDSTPRLLRSLGGAPWEPVVELPVEFPSLAVDDDGDLHALGLAGMSAILYTTGTELGTNWSDTIRISGPDPGARSRPFIEAGRSCAFVHAVWNSRATGAVQVAYRRRTDFVGTAEPAPQTAPAQRLNLVPNPASGFVTLRGAESVVLRDATGSRVAVLREGRNSVSDLRPGVYFATATDGTRARFVRAP